MEMGAFACQPAIFQDKNLIVGLLHQNMGSSKTDGFNNLCSVSCLSEDMFASVMASCLLRSPSRQSAETLAGHTRASTTVGISATSVTRQTLSTPATYMSGHDGCEPPQAVGPIVGNIRSMLYGRLRNPPSTSVI